MTARFARSSIALARISEGAHVLPVHVRTIQLETSRFKDLQPIPCEKGHVKPIQDYGPRRDRAYVLIFDAILKIARESAAANGDVRTPQSARPMGVDSRRPPVSAATGRSGRRSSLIAVRYCARYPTSCLRRQGGELR